MTTRRFLIQATAAAAILPAFPALAQDAARPNPMPDDLRIALERDPTAPVLGNPDGDITLTEFFDYNCPFCRKMVGTMAQLIAVDPQLRVVYHEWPVFGPGSEFAARASLASLQQQNYWSLHRALLGLRGPAEEASVMRAVRQVGLDEERLRRDMTSDLVERHLQTSQELADHMGIVGTPMFIAGDEGIFGEMTLKQLQDLVAQGRAMLGAG